MDNNQQSYWFVVREEQSNVIFSSNNLTHNNPQIVAGQEARYLVDTGKKQYFKVEESPVAVQEASPTCDNDKHQQTTEENFWTSGKVSLLLKLSQEHKYKSSGSDKVRWPLIAQVIGTTNDECSKKFRYLKKQYLKCLNVKKMGKDPKWAYFDACHGIFENEKPNLSSKLDYGNWGEEKVKRLLTLYIDNMPKLKKCYLNDVWRDIANTMGITDYNCRHKFKNLKKTYISIKEKGKTNNKITWPYYDYFERIYFSSLRLKGEHWDDTKTQLLIKNFLSMAHKFKDRNTDKRELWREIGLVVGEPAVACDRKFRNMKNTYLRIKKNLQSGRFGFRWRYYNDFEQIYEESPGLMCNYGADYVKLLLTHYIENKHKFKSYQFTKKKLWRGISSKVGLTPGQCDKKFRSLKQTYDRLVQKGKGNSTWWPYYSYFQQIFDEPKQIFDESSNKTSVIDEKLDLAPVSEIRSTIMLLQDKKSQETFEKLVDAVKESNNIQRERNLILQALLQRH